MTITQIAEAPTPNGHEADDGYDAKEDKLRRLLRRDLRAAAASLTLEEVRYLVDTYYSIQDYRLQAKNQVRAAVTEEPEPEPHLVTGYASKSFKRMEEDIQTVLDEYTDVEPTGMGAWAKGIVGIGPVITAGLLAHIDISKVHTVGSIWRFAGLDPTLVWGKGQKRPFNAKLKVLCWKIGQSFLKFHNHPRCQFGHVYAERKEYELRRNLAGEMAEQAAKALATRKIGKDTEAYKAYSQGMLPPGQIDARARRYAVKLFLAMYFEEAYRRHYKTEPPLPYPIQFLGHAHRFQLATD